MRQIAFIEQVIALDCTVSGALVQAARSLGISIPGDEDKIYLDSQWARDLFRALENRGYYIESGGCSDHPHDGLKISRTVKRIIEGG